MQDKYKITIDGQEVWAIHQPKCNNCMFNVDNTKCRLTSDHDYCIIHNVIFQPINENVKSTLLELSNIQSNELSTTTLNQWNNESNVFCKTDIYGNTHSPNEFFKHNYIATHTTTKSQTNPAEGGLNGLAIQFIHNPSEDAMLHAVKENGLAIQYIHNPSEDVMLHAVKDDGLAIKYIKNPSEDVMLHAVKQNGYAIQFIHNPSEDVMIHAVMQNGWAIQFIHNPSEDVMLHAVKQHKDVIQYFKQKSQTNPAEGGLIKLHNKSHNLFAIVKIDEYLNNSLSCTAFDNNNIPIAIINKSDYQPLNLHNIQFPIIIDNIKCDKVNDQFVYTTIYKSDWRFAVPDDLLHKDDLMWSARRSTKAFKTPSITVDDIDTVPISNDSNINYIYKYNIWAVSGNSSFVDYFKFMFVKPK